jgi:hypothetical protein
MRLKGRHWLVLWLLVFLGTAVAVVARQTGAFRVARRLHDLREERSALEARRADLERRIRVASSRQVLVPVAERRLGLYQPSDSQYRLFPLPSPAPLPEGSR